MIDCGTHQLKKKKLKWDLIFKKLKYEVHHSFPFWGGVGLF